jgi:hypothetical protein
VSSSNCEAWKRSDGFEGTKVKRSSFTYLFFFLAAYGDASKFADVFLRVWRSMLAGLVFSSRPCAEPAKTTSLFMFVMDSRVLQWRFFLF